MSGLCGNFNGDTEDEFVDLETNVVAANPQEYGNLWATSGSCPEVNQTETNDLDPCGVRKPNIMFYRQQYRL